MYEIFKNVINSKRYNLDDMLKKIDTLWVQGDITEEQKNELVTFAQANANPEIQTPHCRSRLKNSLKSILHWKKQ